ncbi:hypothetical protein L596_028031 [Steinernema carpocapsae]|uniref:RRM domain-containing protein n=1 Tax=Steinernema carpocapsae TaxID=34508 RepID=A0A4V5ZXS0_STECR|nr:hypothetical protein L596_028031 [Steinernema carpocapsae]
MQQELSPYLPKEINEIFREYYESVGEMDPVEREPEIKRVTLAEMLGTKPLPPAENIAENLCVCVWNIPENVTEEELFFHFYGERGHVVDMFLIGGEGEPKTGVIKFNNPQNAGSALMEDNTDFMGRKIRVGRCWKDYFGEMEKAANCRYTRIPVRRKPKTDQSKKSNKQFFSSGRHSTMGYLRRNAES